MRDNASGRYQYAQCQADAGCLSTFFFENQRLTTMPSTAPADAFAAGGKKAEEERSQTVLPHRCQKPTFH